MKITLNGKPICELNDETLAVIRCKDQDMIDLIKEYKTEGMKLFGGTNPAVYPNVLTDGSRTVLLTKDTVTDLHFKLRDLGYDLEYS